MHQDSEQLFLDIQASKSALVAGQRLSAMELGVPGT